MTLRLLAKLAIIIISLLHIAQLGADVMLLLALGVKVCVCGE